MTGYTVHSGTTVKFSESWDRIFSEQSAKSSKGNGKQTSASATAKGKAKAKARVKRTAKKKH